MMQLVSYFSQQIRVIGWRLDSSHYDLNELDSEHIQNVSYLIFIQLLRFAKFSVCNIFWPQQIWI